DPRDEQVAFVTFSGLKWRDPTPHVFRTTDAGATWQAASNGLPDAPVNAIALDPSYPDVLYLGTDVGPFVSYEAEAAWEPLGEACPADSIYDLKVIDSERRLVAGSHGRSILTLSLEALPLILARADEAVPAEVRIESAFPNPLRDAVTL